MPAFIPNLTPTYQRLDTFTTAYFEAMEFTDCHADNPDLENADGFSKELIASAKADCEAFQESYAALLEQACETGYTIEQAGHDFWFTRCGHGVGFWDRDLGAIGDALSDAAHAYGNVDLYAGDDGMIYGG